MLFDFFNIFILTIVKKYRYFFIFFYKHKDVSFSDTFGLRYYHLRGKRFVDTRLANLLSVSKKISLLSQQKNYPNQVDCWSFCSQTSSIPHFTSFIFTSKGWLLPLDPLTLASFVIHISIVKSGFGMHFLKTFKQLTQWLKSSLV